MLQFERGTTAMYISANASNISEATQMQFVRQQTDNVRRGVLPNLAATLNLNSLNQEEQMVAKSVLKNP